jgi:hypothetical protein
VGRLYGMGCRQIDNAPIASETGTPVFGTEHRQTAALR